ncbi:MAG: hypothetical protein IJ887_00075 [Prevotella sp.]|nr:hypothetical protein [Prevotella sp.]
MELHTLKKHIVYKDNDVSIYVNKSNSYIQVMIHDCHQRNDYNDAVLIPGDYVDAKTFHGYDILGDEVNTYIVLKKKNGDGKIVRLPDGVTIWSGFLFDDYVMTCCIGSVVNSKFKEDLFVRLHNKQNRIYSIYSLLDSKFSFGPYNYESIEYLWKSGVILDSKLVVNDSGSIWDISNYTRSANSSLVYFNKETDDYRIRIRDGLEHFRELEQSNNENILIAKTRRYEYRYDKKKDQLTTIDKDGFRGWTRRELAEATDIAYEGYSRLELGLED